MEKDPKQFTNLAELKDNKVVVNIFKYKLKNKLKEVRVNNLEIQY